MVGTTKEAIDVDSVVAPLRTRVMSLKEELKSLREGEIPADWMTAKAFFEESEHSRYTISGNV